MRKENILCHCGSLVETDVYPDNWYVLQHNDSKGKILHWQVGFLETDIKLTDEEYRNVGD